MMLDDINTYRRMLRIQKHRLDDELEINAEILDKIGQALARRNSLMLEAKKSLEITEARVLEQVKADDPKMTNPQAEREVKRDREYDSAWKAYQVARQEFEEWEHLMRAWITRSYDIKAMCELHGQQYFAIDSVRRSSGAQPSDTSTGRERTQEAVSRRREQIDTPKQGVEDITGRRRRSLIDD